MSNPLMDVLSGVGDVLSFPGSLVRGGLNSIKGLLTGGDATFKPTTGQELLGLGEDSGLGGTVAGIGADIATDPLTWGGGALLRLLRGAKAAPEVAVGAKAMESPLASAMGQVVDPAAHLRDMTPTVVTKGGSPPSGLLVAPPRPKDPLALNLKEFMGSDPELAAALAEWKAKATAAPFGGFGNPAQFAKKPPPPFGWS